MSLSDEYGFIDKSGIEVIPLKYNKAGPFSEGLAVVKLNDESSFIDKSGKVAIPLKYEFAGPFYEGLASVLSLKF